MKKPLVHLIRRKRQPAILKKDATEIAVPDSDDESALGKKWFAATGAFTSHVVLLPVVLVLFLLSMS